MKKSLIISVFYQILLLSSCEVMQGMLEGVAMASAGMVGGYTPTPTAATFSPSIPASGSIPASWGTGYAGPMTYSNDPIVNSTIAIAQTENRLMSQGVNISNTNTSSTTTRSTTSTTSSSSDNGWYKCCADVENFGIVNYHICSNCGARHQTGSGHMCKRR